MKKALTLLAILTLLRSAIAQTDSLSEKSSREFSASLCFFIPDDFFLQPIREQETDLDLQRGVMLALSKKFLTIPGYYFNPFTSDDFGLLTAEVNF